MSLVLTYTRPRARQPHTCDQCDRKITPGERYHRTEGPAEWGWSTWKECSQCYRLARDLFAIDVWSEDEDGRECYPLLTDVSWPDVELLGAPWPQRHRLWVSRWADGAVAYPTAAGDGR